MDFRIYKEVEIKGKTSNNGTIKEQFGCNGQKHVSRILEILPTGNYKILAVVEKRKCNSLYHQHNETGFYFSYQ